MLSFFIIIIEGLQKPYCFVISNKGTFFSNYTPKFFTDNTTAKSFLSRTLYLIFAAVRDWGSYGRMLKVKGCPHFLLGPTSNLTSISNQHKIVFYFEVLQLYCINSIFQFFYPCHCRPCTVVCLCPGNHLCMNENAPGHSGAQGLIWVQAVPSRFYTWINIPCRTIVPRYSTSTLPKVDMFKLLCGITATQKFSKILKNRFLPITVVP